MTRTQKSISLIVGENKNESLIEEVSGLKNTLAICQDGSVVVWGQTVIPDWNG